MAWLLITGASDGIGKAIVKRFCQLDYDLLLVGRQKEKLIAVSKEIKKHKVEIFPCDLTADDSVKALIEFCEINEIEVEGLINDAGSGIYDYFLNSDISEIKKLMKLNQEVLVELCYHFGQKMVERKKGFILNVASIGSFMPGPLMAVYYAGKSFVFSFTLALRNELKTEGVKVAALCPGPTNTSFVETAGGSKTGVFAKLVTRTPEQVAASAFKLYLHNRAYKVDGPLNAVAVFFLRFLPYDLSAKLTCFIQQKTKKIK